MQSKAFSKPGSFQKVATLSKSGLSKSGSKGFSKSKNVASSAHIKHQICSFGRTERFNNIGFHPELDKSGSMMSKILQLGPGQYTYDDKPVCMHKKYQNNSGWKRETECEDFSKNLGYRNAEILNNRIFMSKHLGPGAHNIPSEIFKKKDHNKCPNRGFGIEKFKDIGNDIPSPGTYFYNTINTCEIKPSTKFSKAERFVSMDKAWQQAPNRYKIKSSARELLDKVVSKRGPYDLFSGDRGNPNTFNKLALVKSCAPDKIYILPSQLDYLLYDKEKRRTGKFFRAQRFPKKPTVRLMIVDPGMCYKDPKFPGPDRYSLKGGIKIVPEAMHSFGTSMMELRPGVRWTTMPGPGRYHVKYPKCPTSKCASWVFKSKTARHEYKAPVYNAF